MPICDVCDRHVPYDSQGIHALSHLREDGAEAEGPDEQRPPRVTQPAYGVSHLPDADVILAGDEEE